MTLKWFISRTVRQATQMQRHVRKLLNAQRDLLSPQAIKAVEQALSEGDKAIAVGGPREKLLQQMSALEETAVKWLRPYPHAGLRENVDVLLVAIAVAMGIRTFFLQPFKIPTGSMQPTLYGITQENLVERPDVEIPGAISRFFIFWTTGLSYLREVAKSDGQLVESKPPQRFLLFNLKQEFKVGNDWYRVWFPPDNLLQRAGLVDMNGGASSKVFRRGQDIIKLRVISGDHLLVDRLTYNFRRPKRGEIVVFETEGIVGLQQDQYYIKRLVGLGGEKLQIGDDRHAYVNGRQLNASTPHFELVYSFAGPPQDSVYSGHLNERGAEQFGYYKLAPRFPTADFAFDVPTNHYIVFGDNTVNSADSRTWGSFPRDNVIGRAYFVYWPIAKQGDRTSRFGWGYR